MWKQMILGNIHGPIVMISVTNRAALLGSRVVHTLRQKSLNGKGHLRDPCACVVTFTMTQLSPSTQTKREPVTCVICV